MTAARRPVGISTRLPDGTWVDVQGRPLADGVFYELRNGHGTLCPKGSLLNRLTPADLLLITDHSPTADFVDFWTNFGPYRAVPRLTHAEITKKLNAEVGPIDSSAEQRGFVQVPASRLFLPGYSGEVWRNIYITDDFRARLAAILDEMEASTTAYDWGGAARSSAIGEGVLRALPFLGEVLKERDDAWFCSEAAVYAMRRLHPGFELFSTQERPEKIHPRALGLQLRENCPLYYKAGIWGADRVREFVLGR